MDTTPLLVSLFASSITFAGGVAYLRRPFDGRAWAAFTATGLALIAAAWSAVAIFAMAVGLLLV